MYKRMIRDLITSLVITLLSSQAVAEDKAHTSTWKGEAELGFISTSGNTDTETLNAKGKFINEREKWKHTVTLESIRISDKKITTAHRDFYSEKTDYKFSDKAYIFGLLKYEDDRFSGYDYQSSIVIGYGRNLVKSDEVKLEAELGAGRRHNELSTGERSNENIAYGSMALDWKVSKTAVFNEKLTVEKGDDATVTKSVSGLIAKINSKFASKITYTIKHVSVVPVGIEKIDREMAVTLVYSF